MEGRERIITSSVQSTCMVYNDLSEAEKMSLSAQLLRAQFLGSERFVEEKLGKQGLKEMNECMAKEAAKAIHDSKFDELPGFGYYCKACAEIAFGSSIELIEKENEIVLIHRKCASLGETKSKNWERKPFCNWCLEFYSLLASELGLQASTKLTDNGCEIRVQKYP